MVLLGNTIIIIKPTILMVHIFDDSMYVHIYIMNMANTYRECNYWQVYAISSLAKFVSIAL